jgi:hypothetical protein
MLISKIISRKRTITKYTQQITDLIYSTFSFPTGSDGAGVTAVSEYENMRPDLMANRLYGDQTKWDAMLKYNGISNPFSVKAGDLLYALPFSALESVYVPPRDIAEREQKKETGAKSQVVSKKDKNRVNNLVRKNNNKNCDGVNVGANGELPPNLSKVGDKSVKVKDGRLVFGEDVTTVNKDNCPTPISRSRLQAALLKDKLFL